MATTDWSCPGELPMTMVGVSGHSGLQDMQGRGRAIAEAQKRWIQGYARHITHPTKPKDVS